MGTADKPPIDIIARRELDVRDSTQKVVLELGRPYQQPTGEFACPYRIKFGPTVTQREMFGEDAFQALQLALKMFAFELHHDKRLPIGQMYWLDTNGGVGFDDPEVNR